MRAVLGVAGSLCLFSGVFLPVYSLPLAADVDYFQHGYGDGVWVALIALASLMLVVLRLYRLLWAPVVFISAVMGHSLYGLWLRKEQLLTLSPAHSHESEVLQLSPMLADSIQLQWGCLVLIAGLLLLVWAAIWPHPGSSSDNLAL